MGVVLLEACDVTQDGGHLDRHLGFYLKLEVIVKRRKFTVFDARRVEYDIIKHFPSFCQHFVFLSPKRELIFIHKKGLTTCYL